MVTKVGKELLRQLKRDRMVLLPLTDKIFGKTEVKDKGVAPPHHPFTDHMSFVFYLIKGMFNLKNKQFFCIIFVILIR